jgi:pyruvate formate lyase activating enzyme
VQNAAVVKCSFNDYPGKIAAVVFASGCNLNCFYCHNRTLIDADSVMCAMTSEEVVEWLRFRRGLLDAVVVSGGEPTLKSGLAGFVAEVRDLGYVVKLDTNGTRPDVLASVIDAGLVDYVAMDIKAPAEKYDAICGVPVDQGAIDESIALLVDEHVDYEFRTTIIHQLTREDILAIGNRIRGARLYVLQQYRELQSTEALNNPRWTSASAPPPWLEDVQQRLAQMVKICLTRGFDINPIPATHAH